MLERGTVIAVAEDGSIDVAMESTGACADCGACSRAGDGARVLEGLANTLHAELGDTVALEVSLEARHRAQWLVYVVPVMALVGGYLAGFLLGNLLGIEPDAVGAVLALVAGASALRALREPARDTGERARYDTHLRAIIAQAKTPQGMEPGGHDSEAPS